MHSPAPSNPNRKKNYSVPITTSIYTCLLEYLTEKAINALSDHEITPGDIDPDWVQDEISWSFTWESVFNQLNFSAREKLALDVQERAQIHLTKTKLT